MPVTIIGNALINMEWILKVLRFAKNFAKPLKIVVPTLGLSISIGGRITLDIKMRWSEVYMTAHQNHSKTKNSRTVMQNILTFIYCLIKMFVLMLNFLSI